MYKDNERFWNSSVDDIKKGYSEDDNSYTCLICNKKFIKGRICKYVDELYDSKKSVEIHIQKEHKSMLEYLLSMNSSFTGLSAVQTEIIKMFAQNISDKEIAAKLDVAQSTIRNHRYKLREKEKQAKIFLSIMQLLSEDTKEGINILDNGFICDAHKTATTLDDRFNKMLGFTKEELVKLMKDQEINDEKIDELMPILKENYDGYKFSTTAKEQIYNSNMCLYFINEYKSHEDTVPKRLIDMNIASDYSKLSKMLFIAQL